MQMINSPAYWNTKDSIILLKSLILARDISSGAKNTLNCLLLYSERDEISISQGRIAEELCESDGTVNKHFLELEKHGYIRLIREPGKSSEIVFTSKSKLSHSKTRRLNE